jgi:hypothetical protein
MATLAQVLRQAGYVTPQGQVVGPRTTTAQTMSNYIRNIIPNAAQNLAQQRSDIDAALTMGQNGIQVGDRAAFERQMAQVPNLMGLTAYHGTPHTIKGKFDISKVGTGEGAQAYGHGMYFAENPEVAKSYMPNFVEKQAQNRLFGSKDINQAISKAKSELEYVIKNNAPASTINEVRQEIAQLEAKKTGANQVGNLYKVDIPDEYIPNMLDWDKPISQQSDAIKKALGLTEDRFANFKIPATGTNYSFSPNMTGSELYRELTNLAKTQAEASKLMNSLGIKGIRYLDEGSRSSGKGTNNFVVFEPSDVKILEQNNKPVTRKEIITKQLEKVSK